MKQLAKDNRIFMPFHFFTVLFFCISALLLAACNAPDGRFQLQGRFRSFNQGEFYIYSLYSEGFRLDTIRVTDGRFNYETDLEDTTIVSLIFPNFSEVPIFVHSGAKIKLSGDASHLREIEISGTEENEKYTQFRLNTNELTPPQLTKAAADYIRKEPGSLVSFYLVNRFFIQTPSPDYKQAAELVGLMLKSNPENRRLAELNQQLQGLKVASMNGRLPQFSAVDTKGRQVGNSSLTGDVNIIYTWASWSFESQNIQRQLKTLQKKHGSRMSLIGICLDPVKNDCQKTLDRDSITWSNVCDGNMWDTPMLKKLGIANVPGNLMTDKNGTIVGINLDRDKLKEKTESILK